MSESWNSTAIGACLDAAFSGEWGTDPRPGNALVFRATDIDDEGRIVGGGALRRLPLGKLASKRLRHGDILLEGSGGGPDKPVGRVAYFDSDTVDEPAVCSNFFKTLRPTRGKVDPRFLARKLGWFHKQPAILALQQQTTGIINLKFEEYLASQISVPQSVSEQGKIAQILDTLDTAIHETEAIIAKLKAVKQGLLHDLLTRGINANGELRPPHAEAPHLYKRSPLGWIPKEWDVKSGCAVCREIVVGIVIRPTQYYRPEGIPVFRSANVRENRLSMADLVFMSERDHRSHSKSAVRPGDVLTVRTGYPGTSCVVDCSVREANCVDILISRPSNELDATFWSLWINSPLGKSQVLAVQGGLAQQHFNVGDLQKLLVSVPALLEQIEIARRLTAAEQRIDAEREAWATLTNSKSGLMDDLLTGRVRVTPLLQEPATA